ncbi:MAG TPA: helical backbone metal receptor [Chitinophagaceae bacterium]|nr:helical backbone metal receptor [Chitinophagaceae bacterium]
MWKITIDQAGYELKLENIPRRIISVVPSQTELLYHLGLEEEVVGITKFCVHPEAWFRNKKRVGGTKTLDIDLIRELRPDLVIANKEENTKEDVLSLRAICPVWTSDIHTITEALAMIREVGGLVGKAAGANLLASEVRSGFGQIRPFGLRSAYLIWKNPFMAAGGDTFISDMMRAAGLENVFTNKSRYPEMDLEDLRAAGIELLLLSSEPYPFKMKDIESLNEVLPQTRIVLADGEMFSWYGSRMREFPAYLDSMNW